MDAGGQLWDAMVVGAGPAGCAAAYDLAAAGQSVLLLDKKDFPRAKACAGGLTSKAVQALRYSIEPVVRKVVGRVRLEGESPSSSPADAVVLKSREPICVMTVRAELDEYCLRKTIAAGACLRKDRGRAADCALRRAGAFTYPRRKPIARAFWSAPMEPVARYGGCARPAPGFPRALRWRSKLRHRGRRLILPSILPPSATGTHGSFPRATISM